jgi:hypothetical protein
LKLAEYIPLLLLFVLLCLLMVRRSFRSFPWFTFYVCFAVLADVARFIVRNDRPAYKLTYWTTEGIYAALGIAVMYEVFRKTFGNLGRFAWPRYIFPIMMVVSVVLTIGRGEGVPTALHDKTLIVIIQSEIAVRFLQVLVFVAMVVLVPLVGLQWRQYAFGIAMGFGLYSTFALLTTTRFSILGQTYHLTWGWALIISYSCAVLIWLLFFSAAEKPTPPGSTTPALSFAELNLYRRFIRRIIK